MLKSIEQLEDDLAIAEETARFWLEAKTDASKELGIAQVKFIEACREADLARVALETASGEPS